MPCKPFEIPGGGWGIACTPRGREKLCRVAHCREPRAAQCDWKLHIVVDGKPKYTGRTCDMNLCEGHRNTVGKHVGGQYDGEPKDLCPPHYAEAKKRGLVK